ncbi:hypothetical protein Tco_1073555 [Tanacetum coccineum]
MGAVSPTTGNDFNLAFKKRSRKIKEQVGQRYGYIETSSGGGRGGPDSGGGRDAADGSTGESSTGHNNGAQPAYSNAASADSLRSCKTEPNPCYGRQYSNISFSNLTGESTAGDYQDCGAS